MKERDKEREIWIEREKKIKIVDYRDTLFLKNHRDISKPKYRDTAYL